MVILPKHIKADTVIKLNCSAQVFARRIIYNSKKKQFYIEPELNFTYHVRTPFNCVLTFIVNNFNHNQYRCSMNQNSYRGSMKADYHCFGLQISSLTISCVVLL